MQKDSHPGKKIPLHRGHVIDLAKDLKMHRNTLLKKWSSDDPHIIYAVALRQVQLLYPQSGSNLQRVKDYLMENYERRSAGPDDAGAM